MIRRGAAFAAVAAATACGGSNEPATSPTPQPDGVTITITAAGASPRTLAVAPGTQITFVNSDGAVHQMYSDPHPEHTDCPEFDSVGQLNPGQRRQTKNLVNPGTCGFHDHLNPFNNTLKGTITIR
jgi:plastocyanin